METIEPTETNTRVYYKHVSGHVIATTITTTVYRQIDRQTDRSMYGRYIEPRRAALR